MHALIYNNNLQDIAIPPSVAHVATAQDDIGWHQILKGRYSLSWASYQDSYLGSKATSRNNGLSWVIGLIDAFFKEWWKLWTIRNEDRHGKDLQSRQQAENGQAIRELQQIYDSYEADVAPELEHVFNTPIQTLQAQTTNSIRMWINTWKPALEESYATRLETG